MPPAPPFPKILIVDDDEGITMLMADTLRVEGYDVATVGSGSAALKWLEERRPDLMLLDLKLRDVGGPALVEQLARGDASVPFLVVTGQGDEKAAVQVMKQGALDYVMKDTGLLDLLPTVVRGALRTVEQNRALLAAQSEQKRLEQAVLEAAEHERHLIGADLHDGLGQQLTALEFMCTALKSDAGAATSDLAQRLDQMGRMLREAISQTRYLARGLVPVGSDPDALRNSIAELVDRTNMLGRAKCHFNCPQAIELTNAATAGHLYRIAQEGINNALKHADATNITVALTRSSSGLQLDVCDNGKGLPKSFDSGLGLRVMRYRANMIGAEFEVASRKNEGTTISCLLPSKS